MKGEIDKLNKAETPEQRRARTSKAGKASAEARRHRKELRSILDELLTMDSEALEGMSNAEALCISMIRKAVEEKDVSAANWVRDTAGQKPVEKREIRQEDIISYDQREAALRAFLIVDNDKPMPEHIPEPVEQVQRDEEVKTESEIERLINMR